MVLGSGAGRQLDKDGPLADAKALGADASLAKPFQIKRLVEVVGDLLAGQ